MDRPQEAIACQDEAIELDPDGPDAWSGKAAALDALGDAKGAE